MKISISNIAWDQENDIEVAKILNNEGINYVDIAPSKYFDDFKNVPKKNVIKVRDFWISRNIVPYGMQSLLFKQNHLNLFDQDSQIEMLDYLENVFKIASLLEIKKLVFGSPRNRDSSVVESSSINRIATEFFYRLGEIAKKYDLTICLEPNPEIYGCNFLINSKQVLSFVKKLDHPNIRMQLDTGALIINNEDITEVLANSMGYIGHIHLSEPNLVELGKTQNKNSYFSEHIKKHLDSMIVSIEMLKQEDTLKAISDSIMFANKHYN